MSIDSDKILELAKKLEDAVREKGFYTANIIDELHASENAHSRILRMLLAYKGKDRNNPYPLLNSFLDIEKIKKVINGLDFSNLQITNESGRIDLLIERPGDFAIIVENKVMDACDQDRQIERYINFVSARGIDKKSIYVIYLTFDGSKSISEYSLTPEAKTALDIIGDNSGRFIALNYRDDVLKWLDSQELNRFSDEHLLNSAITQYTDYLKGMCGIRNNELDKFKKDLIMEEGKINNLKNCQAYIDSVNNLSETLYNIREDMIQEIANKNIIIPLKTYLEKLGDHKDDYKLIDNETEFHYDNIVISIKLPQTDKSRFKLETYNHHVDSGIANYSENLEDNERINNIHVRWKEYKSSPWWPAWKSWLPLMRVDTPEFWHEVESGDFLVKFKAEFKSLISNITSCHDLSI